MKKYEGTKQLTCNISEDHMNKLNELWTYYKESFPLARVSKYKVLETIIEDQHKAIFKK